MYTPALAAHLVWHPACRAAEHYARALFVQLFDDPDDLAGHGLRIPVRLWRSTGASNAPPPGVPPMDVSERAVVVVLVDDEFVAADGWLDTLDSLAAAARPDDIVFCVTLTDAVLPVQSSLLRHNAVRLHDLPEALRCPVFVNRVTHAVCRAVIGTEERVKVFISHAKSDGVEIAQTVRRHLSGGSGIEDFFDAQDLLEGSLWATKIRAEAAASVLLAIRTDAYATREWCRTEVLEAKRAGSPVVVLDALAALEPRGFPYLGNAPCVRWSEGSPPVLEELLRVVLRETLRFRQFPARVADLCRAYNLPAHDRVLPSPPELLTVLGERDAASAVPLVYPDPPLGTEELRLITELAPNLRTTTPTGLMVRR